MYAFLAHSMLFFPKSILLWSEAHETVSQTFTCDMMNNVLSWYGLLMWQGVISKINQNAQYKYYY